MTSLPGDGIGPDDPEWRSGLLPPDGEPWPPAPASPAPAARPRWETLATPPERPVGDAPPDWRVLPVDAPDGYRGSASAPPAPPSRWETWCVTAIVAAAAGVVVAALPIGFTPTKLVLPLLALGFGFAGRRACALDPTRRGRLPAGAAIVAGAVTVLLVATSLLR